MTVKEAFYTPDDGGGVRTSGEARREFSMPNVLALKKRKDRRGEQLHLILAKSWIVRGQAARQLGENFG